MAASGRDTRSNPIPKFEVGEKVLCYEPDSNKARVLYESKVLEVDITKDEKGRKVPEYFIHFNGWNKSWDRWVMEGQVQKDSENNRLLMIRLHEQALKSVRKKRRLTQNSESKETDGAIKTEGKVTDLIENQELPKIELEIPSQLKLKLEDDCYFIKRKKKLVQVPRTPNVAQILNDYYQHYKSFYPGQSSNLLKEVMDGLRIYFDFTLPTLLLYNFEREQYQSVMKLLPATRDSGATNPGRSQGETNGKALTDDKYGVVSSSSETSGAKKEAVESANQVERQEGENSGKQERLLRRRTLRNQPSASEASQSATVSSTSSSPPESHSVSIKRKAIEAEESHSNGTESSATSARSSFPTSPIPSSLSVSTHTMPSQIYGPEHLLRLFVKLPGLLARTDMPEKNVSVLLEQINTFLRYLAEKSSILFSEDVYYNSLL